MYISYDTEYDVMKLKYLDKLKRQHKQAKNMTVNK